MRKEGRGGEAEWKSKEEMGGGLGELGEKRGRRVGRYREGEGTEREASGGEGWRVSGARIPCTSGTANR